MSTARSLPHHVFVALTSLTHAYCLLLTLADGSELKKPLAQQLSQDITAVGSDKAKPLGPGFLRLRAPDIHPQHCVIAHLDGIVTITPGNADAETYIGDNRRVSETTVLQHGTVVRFGRHMFFRFIDPLHLEVRAPRSFKCAQRVCMCGQPIP